MAENSSCSSASSCSRESCEGCPSKAKGGNGIAKEPMNPSSNVKKVIGVVSGKGGVGKSFVTASLACAMKQAGYKVGIMDADITGPSIPKMLGVHGQVVGTEEGMIPLEAENGIKYLAKTLEGYLDPEVERNLLEIIDTVEGAKAASFKMVFDPTLVRGMSYYTGTIFEISMPELGAACGGGGRYDKMVGKFTGQDVPACGFSIGFERIILLLMESGFTVPTQRPKVAYLIEKGCPAEKLGEIIGKAQEERAAGKQVLVVRMNKNKKFQKEKLDAEGYKEIVEFFNK